MKRHVTYLGKNVRRYGVGGVCLAALVWAAVAVWPRLRAGYDCNMAAQAMGRGDIASAMESLHRAERINRADADVQFLLAVAYRRAGQMEAFRDRLQRAAALGTSAEDIQREQWLAAIQTGQLQPVESQIQHAITGDVTSGMVEEVYEAVTKGYLAAYRLREARSTMEAWLAWRADSAPALLLRGELFHRLGDRAKAIEDYRAALAQLPGNRDVLVKLGRILLQENRPEEAQSYFRQCLSAAPSDVEALLGTAECARLLGNTAEAHREIAAILGESLSAEQRRRATLELGRLLLMENKLPEAAAALREAVAAAPWEPEPHIFLATALARSGQAEESRREHERVEEIRSQQLRMDRITRRLTASPNDADLRCEAGRILIAQGMTAEGIAWLNTALACDPKHRKTHQLLADYYTKVGNPELAAYHRTLANP